MESDTQGTLTKFQAGDIIDKRYAIVEVLGAGGMSVVYKAKDQVLERDIALKVLNQGFSADSMQAQRFRNEAQVTALLDHPNIVKVLACGVAENGCFYIVMELLQGMTLDHLLKEKGRMRMNRDELAELFLPLLSALVYAHSMQIIHRDLKPGNIMISISADGQRVPRILDFGIAKILEKENQGGVQQRATMAMLGSPLYMSPEQINGSGTDERSDIYSLACLMYEALTSRPPFVGETPLETMYEHLRSSVPKMNEISASMNISKELVDALIQALSKEPSGRPETMKAFQQQIELALQSTHKITKKKSLWLWVVAPVLVVCVLMVFAFGKQLGAKKSEDWQEKPVQKSTISGLSGASLMSQGKSLWNENRKEESAKYFQKAIRAFEASGNITDKAKEDLLTAHMDIGYVYLDKSKFKEARREFEEAIKFTPAPSSAARLLAAADLIKLLRMSGDKVAADKAFQKYVAEAEKMLAGEASYELADFLTTHSKRLIDDRNYDDAIKVSLKAQSHYDRLRRGRTYEPAVDNCWLLWDCYTKQGKTVEAEKEIETCKSQMMEMLDGDPSQSVTTLEMRHYNVANSLFTYAEHASESGRLDDAEKMYRLCIDHSQRGFYPEDSRLLQRRSKQGLEKIRLKRASRIAN